MSRGRSPRSGARSGGKHSVTVQIAGEKHVLRSDAPPEYTHACAAHVDETIRQLGSSRALEPHRTAILAAMYITDELMRAREELQQLRAEMDRRSELIAELLERSVESGREDAPIRADPAAEPR